MSVELKAVDDRPQKGDIYRRIHAWGLACGEVNPLGTFAVVVNEVGELAEAVDWGDEENIRLETGDVAFAVAVLYDVGHRAGLIVDDEVPGINEIYDLSTADCSPTEFLMALRDLGESIVKPKKQADFGVCCGALFAMAAKMAKVHDNDFERDCLLPVIERNERRLATGKSIAGVFVKEEGLQ